MMSPSILVAYATRYGSTQETAEAIAAVLRQLEYEVDLLPMRQVNSIDKYGAVVMGAPLQIGRWHGDAHRFLSQYRQALGKLPVAVFALGPLHRNEKEMQEARAQLDKELAKVAWFRPLVIQMFVGRIDPTKLHFPFSLTFGQVQASDEMDWAAIRDWAGTLPAILGLELWRADAVPQAVD
jgi:menaquinone-dependent protoporphyrinogen oxidase